jgi:hypothetical protein
MVVEVSPTPRQARLYVTRVDAWSVAKTSFLLSIALGIVSIVAAASLWYILDALEVFSTLAKTVNDVVGNAGTNFDLETLLSLERVVGVTAVLASVQIVLTTLLAVLLAGMYNLTVGLTGGVEVVLTDDV